MDHIDWHLYFRYDPQSPSGLVRLNDWRCGSDERILRAKAGDVAGCRDELGYYNVKVNDISFLCHRIVMCLNGFSVDGNFVDHEDQNPSNNKIDNLRLSSPANNSRNRKLPKTNTSGVVGVGTNYTKSSNGTIHKRWRAEVRINGKKKCKFYSVSVHGEEEAFRLACEWRRKMIEELNAQGAGYTDKHGESK
jgi:hypothetical protein